jgi:hypothetical protein
VKQLASLQAGDTICQFGGVLGEQQTYAERKALEDASGTAYNVPRPEWVNHPRYILTTPWWPEHAYALSIRIQLMRITPAPFVQRNIFCGNRLYQNKYEMSVWAQEARASGITNPGEIFRYARQKEIGIHGG